MASQIDPLFLGFLRFFISGLIFLSISFRDIKKVNRNDFFKLILAGFIGVTIGIGSFHIGLSYLEASKSAVIFSINPIFSSIYAFIFLKEKIKFKEAIGIILGFVGVYVVSFGFKVISFENILGPLLLLVSATGFGIYVAFAKPYLQKYGTFLATSIMFISGSIPYLFFIDSFKIQNFEKNIYLLSYLIFITSTLANFLYFYGLKKVPLSIGTSLFYLKPIIASIFSVIILKESLYWNFYIGLGIIFLGLFLIIFKKSKS